MTPTAGGSQRDAAPAVAKRAGGWRTPAGASIAFFTIVALGLRVFMISRPGYLLGVTQYDDGPYFGSAVRLVHGVLPYRDFIIVQPPGITVLMSPAALLSDVTGTAWGMAAGRILTVAASTISVLLAGLLVRHRGLTAVTVCCGILAVYPGSLIAAHTVFLEPWLVLLCLIGALAVFDGDKFASNRRLMWGGVAFGVAGAVEVWAVLPVAAIALLLLPRLKRLARFVAGVAVGFLIPVVPFAALAPATFYKSFFAAQLLRVVPHRTPVWYRLKLMTGLAKILHLSNTGVLTVSLIIVAFIVAAYATSWLVTRRPPAPLDWFAAASTAIVSIAFLWYAQFFLHFPAFLAPFLALALGLGSSRLVRAVAPAASRIGIRGWARWPLVSIVGALVVVLAVQQGRTQSNVSTRVSPAGLTAARRIIPPGACVLTDQVSFTIAANRFTSGVPGCSRLVDSIGTDYALGHGRDALSGAGRYTAVGSLWRRAFDHASFVWLSSRNARRIPWTPGLTAYFTSHFHRVYTDGSRDVLYARKHG